MIKSKEAQELLRGEILILDMVAAGSPKYHKNNMFDWTKLNLLLTVLRESNASQP